MTTLRARYDGRVFIPEEPVDLPADCLLELQLRRVGEGSAASPTARLAEVAARFAPDPDAPIDGAAQHDHYLYGTPKRK